MPHTQQILPAHPITHGPKHHFFGYFDKMQFDATGRHLLGLEVDFIDRRQTGRDTAVIGMVDTTKGNAWSPLTETRAWNWQQGCALQWLPDAPTRFIFNDIENGRFVSVIFDTQTGKRRTLPRPVYHVAPNGQYAITLNFARLARTRPGYGYYGLPDPTLGVSAPANDGLFRLDLKSGKSDLIVSLADIVKFKPSAGMVGAEHKFNHLLFSSDSRRFIFLHRWRQDGRKRHRMFTARADGSGIYLLNDHAMTSHFCWLGSTHVLAYAVREDRGEHYYLFKDCTAESEVIGGGVLTADGHCTFSPVNPDWVLTDTYPQGERHERMLILYHRPTNTRIDIGAFYSMRALDASQYRTELRCDLHPRWSRDGRKVCFDSSHENSRQMYAVDVSGIVGTR